MADADIGFDVIRLAGLAIVAVLAVLAVLATQAFGSYERSACVRRTLAGGERPETFTVWVWIMQPSAVHEEPMVGMPH